MSCKELGARMMVVSRLGHFLPGSFDGVNHIKLFIDPTLMKCAYFRLMPNDFKVKFAENRMVLDDNTYTYQSLVHFLADQEGISKGRKHKALEVQQG